MTRKHPLEVGGWAMDMQGRVCKLIAVRELIDGTREFTVRYPGSYQVDLLEGFLDYCPSEFAP